jgi:hypothetical protein
VFKRSISALLLLALLVPASSALAQGEKPKPDITFTMADTTFTAQQDVPMEGNISPATAPEEVTIKVQKFNNKTMKWKFFESGVIMSDDNGDFSTVHPPMGKGQYRARAEIQETDDHLAGKNRWVKYRVRRHF